MYVKGRVKARRERERQGTRVFQPLVHSLPKMAAMARPGLGARSQEPHGVPHVGGRGTNTWVITHCFPRHISRELNCKRSSLDSNWCSAMECGHGRCGLAYAATTPAAKTLYKVPSFRYVNTETE